MLFAAAALRGQTPATFQAGTNEVLVDAVVADKKGAFQADLTRADFKIWEDGKEQTITGFWHDSEAPSRHYIALLFENERPGLRDEMAQFVDRFAAPDLYFEVYSRGDTDVRIEQAFTTDAGLVKAALRSMQISADKFGSVKGLAQGRDPVCGRISSVAAALAQVHGRKALMVFGLSYSWVGRAENSGGPGNLGPIPESEIVQVRKTVDDCNRAGVSVYSFQLGTRSRGASVTTLDIPRAIAIGTGGKYTPAGSYDLAAYLNGAAADQRAYYLLSYSPSAGAANKPCHKVKVTVDRKGLVVNARESYCLAK